MTCTKSLCAILLSSTLVQIKLCRSLQSYCFATELPSQLLRSLSKTAAWGLSENITCTRQTVAAIDRAGIGYRKGAFSWAHVPGVLLLPLGGGKAL